LTFPDPASGGKRCDDTKMQEHAFGVSPLDRAVVRRQMVLDLPHHKRPDRQ
jgi:hypothetical protein